MSILNQKLCTRILSHHGIHQLQKNLSELGQVITPREMIVLKELTLNKRSQSEIADLLNISQQRVSQHRKKLEKKLQVLLTLKDMFLAIEKKYSKHKSPR